MDNFGISTTRIGATGFSAPRPSARRCGCS